MRDRLITVEELIEVFFKKDFSFGQASKIFGDVRMEQESFIILQPRLNSNISMVKLEKMTIKPGDPVFLAGIVIEFDKPESVRYKDLSKRFGEAVQMPGIDPEDIDQQNDTVMYRWMIKNDEFAGYLILESADDLNSVFLRCRTLVLRRFPPELWKYSAVIEMGLPPNMVQAAIVQE